MTVALISFSAFDQLLLWFSFVFYLLWNSRAHTNVCVCAYVQVSFKGNDKNTYFVIGIFVTKPISRTWLYPGRHEKFTNCYSIYSQWTVGFFLVYWDMLVYLLVDMLRTFSSCMYSRNCSRVGYKYFNFSVETAIHFQKGVPFYTNYTISTTWKQHLRLV